jgi:hypothetical protein
VGPTAPTGYSSGDCPRVGIKFEEADNTPDPIGSDGIPGDSVVFQLEGRRGLASGQWKNVEWILFGVIDNANPTDLGNISPCLFFGSSDFVSTELRVKHNGRRGYTVTVLGGNGAGRFSHIYSYSVGDIARGFRYRVKARAIGGSTIAMAPPGLPNAEFWTPYFLLNQVESVKPVAPVASAPGTFRANFGSTTSPAGRSLLVQRNVLQGGWSNWDTALLPAAATQFFFRDPLPPALASTWRAWEIIDPAGSGDPSLCPHDARPEGASEVSPIKIVLTLPVGSKEYRLYRRIDNGALTLLKQDVETWDDTTVQAVMHSDGLIPPAGGRIGYYGQVFDEHGNPSPLVLLGEKVTAVPELPIPTMDTAEAGGTSTAPTMTVRAVCPSPGVERIELSIDPPPASASGMTTFTRLGSKLFGSKYGSGDAQPANYTVSLMTPSILEQDPSVPVTLDTTVNIKEGVKYKIKVRAIGLGGIASETWSLSQDFTWMPPLTGDTVAWPARPVPEVISWNPLVKAFRVDAFDFLISPTRLTATPPDDYPVAIRIGRIPLASAQPKSENPASNWDVRGVQINFGGTFVIWGYFGIGDAVGFTDNPPNQTLLHQYLAPKITGYGDIPSIDTSQSLFPIVLYRRQTARLIDGVSIPTPDTDIIQTSSMINSISWVGDPAPPRNPDLALFIDPFVTVAMLEPNAQNPAADLCLFDNSPVAAGATYQYYLVHFDRGFEPESIINAGTLTFPEAP